MRSDKRSAVIQLAVCILGVWASLFGVICFQRYLLTGFPLGVRMVLMPVLYWLIMPVPVILAAISKDKLSDYGFGREKLPLQILIGVIIGAVMSLVFTLLPILAGFGAWVDAGVRYTEWWQLLYEFFYCILAVGLAEEFIFRGFIVHKLRQIKDGELFAGVASSVLFGLFHIFGGNAVQIIVTAALGGLWYLCRVRVKHCSLLSLTVAHGVYDALIRVWNSLLLG